MDSFSNPSLPTYCQPTHPFLEYISGFFSTCIPTPESFISSIFGLLSIAAWLFAQLPQIYKNYRNRSVEGLSPLFLLNWLLGDVCNLGGALLLNQMFFQKFIGGYYVIVDLALVSQWIWYAVLVDRGEQGFEYVENKVLDGSGSEVNVIEGTSPLESGGEDGSVKGISIKKGRKSLYDTSFPGTPALENPAIGTPGSSRWNFGSGRNTVQTMFVFMTLFAFALAFPEDGSEIRNRRAILVSPFAIPGGTLKAFTMVEGQLTKEFIGGIVAWLSAILYCSSRISQILKNNRRRSCSGLSITLFIAAFLGNVFYSLSLLSNPLGRRNYDPYGGGGIAGPEGSNVREWWRNSFPFLLGASGVLFQDGIIFCQFLVWREKEPSNEDGMSNSDPDSLLRVEEEWTLVSPWRKWIPHISIEVTDVKEENKRLLGSAEEHVSTERGNDESLEGRIAYGTIP